MDKLRMATPDLTQANIEKLAALFPACVTEARGEDGRLKKAVNLSFCGNCCPTWCWRAMRPMSLPG